MDQKAKFSPSWGEVILPREASLKEAVASLHRSGLLLVALIVGEKLVAILTDSDLRKALLAGADLEGPALPWAAPNPQTRPETSSYTDLYELCSRTNSSAIPLVDESGRLCDIYVRGKPSTAGPRLAAVGNFREAEALPNAMFILAGGFGKRLRSIFPHTPKPLARLGETPLLQIVIEHAVSCGFRKFFVSVHYMAEEIEKYFSDLGLPSAEIEFFREVTPLGTAGSLSFIKGKTEHPLVVCNSDILTTVRFDTLLFDHMARGADLTCAVRPYEVLLPFGVVDQKDGQMVGVREKPRISYLINSGIYVLNPSVFNAVPAGIRLDMPELIQSRIGKGDKVLPFFLHEYWIDIGRPEDYTKAAAEYPKLSNKRRA